MPIAFPNLSGGGHGLGRSLKNLANALRGSLVGDSNEHVKVTPGTVASELDVQSYESIVRTFGSAGVETVQLGQGTHIGQLHKVTFGTQVDPSDSVYVTGGPNSALQTAAAAPNVVVMSVKLDAAAIQGTASVYVTSPVNGRISYLMTVSDAVFDADWDTQLELGGTKVANSELTIATSGSAIGTVDSEIIAAGATTLVTKGQQVEVLSDGVPTTGECTAFISFIPNGVGAPVPVIRPLPATQYAAGTSVWALAPVNGRIRRVRTVTTATTTAVGTVGLELEGVAVQGSEVTVATGATVGTLDDSGEIYDKDSTNYVNAGDPIEITSDGTPSAGSVDVIIEIDPNMGRAPIVVDTLLPATQLAAGTSVFIVAPCTGFVDRVRTVTDVLLATAAEELALELGGTLVIGSETTIADESPIGDTSETDDGALLEVATAAVTLLDPVEITCDGGASAGEAEVWVEFIPTTNIAGVALADPGDFVLFECKGAGLWEIVQTNGIVS
jgi:hypothetical protein